MADWRDNLQRVVIGGLDEEGRPRRQVGGSFRGIPFFVESHEFVSGRRKVDHEFPQRDISRSEDLGRKIRKFTLEMFVLGDDYFQQRDNLLEALEAQGSGELIHPYLGKKNVQVGNFSLNETVQRGRIATFSVDFTETGEALFPDETADASAAALTAADSMIEESKGFFETIFSVAQQAEFVIDKATENLQEGLDFLEDSVSKFTDPIDSVTAAILNLKQTATALVRAPEELANKVAQTFELLFQAVFGIPNIAELIFGNFSGFVFEPVLGATPSAIRTQTNQTAMQNFFKQQAHANQAKSAIEIDFSNAAEAIRVRDRVVNELDLQLNEDITDDLFQDIKDVQTNLVQALPPITAGTLLEFTPPKTLPSLVIVHSLFQDLDKEQELIDQNGIQHPGFVPGRVPLEISSG